MRKLALLFIFIHFFLLQAVCQPGDDAPLLTIEFEETTLGELLDEISKQSGLDFSYNSRSININKKLSFSIKEASLETTLKELSNITDLDYILIENQIVLNLPKDSGSSGKKEEAEFFTISGFLNDKSSGESLIGATVLVKGTSKGAITNAFGFYSLQLAKGTYAMDYSYVGYQVEERKVELNKNEKLNLTLQSHGIDLPDVIVATPLEVQLENRGLDRMDLRPSQLSNMPEFGGESGLIKGLQSLPGIKMNSDGSAFFYTRGGEKDQNLIIIDDAPIYNPAHLFGFYSMVIPDFAKSIQVYKSDIPTNLGDRLSSIINIRTKDGNLNNFQFSGALNPLINRLALEIPLAKNSGAIFTSLRVSNLDWIYRNSNENLSMVFGDFSFKWNQKFSDKNRWFFTLITAADGFDNPGGAGASGISWGNLAATLRWNHIYGPKLFSNTVLYTGTYNYLINFAANSWQSSIGNLSFKMDFTHYMSSNFTSRFGIEFQGYSFNPGNLSTGDLISFLPGKSENRSGKGVAHYQADYSFSGNWKLSAGLRLSSWQNVGPLEYYLFDENYEVSDTINAGEGAFHTYVNLDPRLSLQYSIDSSAHIKVSLGRYSQYLQLISNSVSPFTALEVWLPSSPNIEPQRAYQASLSYLKYFSKPKLEFSASAYFKQMNNQIDYVNHANTLLNPLLESELRFGELQAYGLEFLLKKDFGRLSGWMNYTWSRAIRQTDEINNGDSYPAFQDRPHDFSIMLNYKLKKRILFSAYWTAYTGSAFSSPTGFYTFNQQTVPIYSEKNNDRLPQYRRFDFAFKFILNKKEDARYQHNLTFSIYNAFAHKNIVAVNFNKQISDSGTPEIRLNTVSERDLVVTQTDLIRFLPSLTYKFKL